jgi:hypothetical protein
MEKTFSEMAKEAFASSESQASQSTQDVQETTQVTTPEAQATEGQDSHNTEDVASTAAPVESKQSVDFLKWMADKGYDVDGVDPEEMYLQVESIIRESVQTKSELEKLREQLQSRPQAPEQTLASVEAQAREEQRQEQQRRLQKLQVPDQKLYSLVEKEGAYYIPKAAYGQEAVRAAEQINHYHEEKLRRADNLLVDPLEFLGEDLDARIEARAQSLIEKQWEQFQEKQRQEREKAEQENRMRTVQERKQGFYEKYKGNIFHLDTNGEPRRQVVGDGYAISSSGDKFFQELNRLQTRYPGADEVTLMEDAMENVLRLQSVAEVRQPVAQAPVVQPQVMQPQIAAPQTMQQQMVNPQVVRQQYSAQNRTHVNQVPSQGTRVADLENRPANSRPMRFRDMIYADPANADNPALTAN